MLKKLVALIILSLTFLFGTALQAHAVPVRTHGGVNASSGNYILRSENEGNGNRTPGSNVTVDSYLFQCKSKGSAACSTELNSDATLVQKWQNTHIVPQLHGSTSQVTHTFTLPYGQCGRIQYDQGVVGIQGAIGGWVHDFGVDCPNSSPPPQNTCSSQQEVNTQFRFSDSGSTTPWISGTELTNYRPQVGRQVDVNCFAKTGTALLSGGVVDVTMPNGQVYRASNSPELRKFTLTSAGNYTFTCSSTTINNCSNEDRFTVQVSASPVPTPIPTPVPTPVPTPIPSPTPQLSTCDSLQVISGNDGTVPARITFRARGSDNKGAIQAYRYYFGDGERVETNSPEITHEYNISGTYVARVEIKDSVGNYKTSNSCEAQVRIKLSNVESHKFGCSDIFVTANNGGRAPSTVKFTITGYDNKGSVGQYKLDFGNGIVKESEGQTFEQLYDKSGTYVVRGYIKNSKGEWVTSDTCKRTMTIGSTQPLTVQPSTGTSTFLPILGISSGAIGMSLKLLRRRRGA